MLKLFNDFMVASMNIIHKDFLVNEEPTEICLLLLHGLGSDGHDMMGLAKHLKIEKNFTAVCPTAGELNITINSGLPYNAWFDILNIEQGTINFDELLSSVNEIAILLDDLTSKYKTVFLLGFSQGGAVSLTTGLTYNKKLAGIVGLSTFFPGIDDTLNSRSIENKDTPILLTHGIDDEVLNVGFAKNTKEILDNANVSCELKIYDNLSHGMDDRVLKDVTNWIIMNIPKESSLTTTEVEKDDAINEFNV